LRLLPVNFLWPKVDKHQVIVGAARNNAITVLSQSGRERFGVSDDLPLIFPELRLKRFVKTNRFRCNHMHERAALHSREKRRVDLFSEFFLAQHDAAARPAQTFVRRGRDKLRMRNRARVLTSGHQPGDMRHVDKQNRANGVSNLA
jgi:hypothetical protein